MVGFQGLLETLHPRKLYWTFYYFFTNLTSCIYASGPRCHIKQKRARRLQLCLDGKTDYLEAVPCNFNHEKLFSFGPSPFVEDDSRNVPVGSIYLSLEENDDIIDYCIAELSNEDGEKYVGFVYCEEDEHVIEFAVVPFIVEES